MTARVLTCLLLLAAAPGALAQAPITLKSAVVVLSDDPALRAEVGPDAMSFEGAARHLAQRLRARQEYDVLVMPSLTFRPAKLRTRRVSWDGVDRRLETVGEPTHSGNIILANTFHGEMLAPSLAVFVFSPSGELLFGGREIYGVKDPNDIPIHIRRQIAETYPALRDIEITHAWGGYVGITIPRTIWVREVMPNVLSVGGYSGHGVMLSNFVGKLYAETVTGNRDRLKLFKDYDIPAFPGGTRFRQPLLFLALSWYALRDRF